MDCYYWIVGFKVKVRMYHWHSNESGQTTRSLAMQLVMLCLRGTLNWQAFLTTYGILYMSLAFTHLLTTTCLACNQLMLNKKTLLVLTFHLPHFRWTRKKTIRCYRLLTLLSCTQSETHIHWKGMFYKGFIHFVVQNFAGYCGLPVAKAKLNYLKLSFHSISKSSSDKSQVIQAGPWEGTLCFTILIQSKRHTCTTFLVENVKPGHELSNVESTEVSYWCKG